MEVALSDGPPVSVLRCGIINDIDDDSASLILSTQPQHKLSCSLAGTSDLVADLHRQRGVVPISHWCSAEEHCSNLCIIPSLLSGIGH